ncbi:lipase family protein [Sporobolomyces koalae]|uniref:lipase family protein n=1 Tax=Sporobolomyces koalae TaxID=500713 RepID=UPI0031786FA2
MLNNMLRIWTSALMLANAFCVLASPVAKRALSNVEGARIETAARLAMAAYGDPALCSAVIPGTKILSRFTSPLGQRGYIAKVPSLKTVVIQFTGTSNFQNAVSDEQFLPISLNSADCGTGCLGYSGAVLNYRDAKRATNSFAAAFNALEAGYTLTITGHSLGGAVAAIAGVDLPADFLITFGEFRVGNPATARFIDQKYGSNTYRVVHALDSVPAIVPRTINNQHHGRAFLLAGTTLSSLSECSSAESLKCDGGVNSADHLLYFVPTSSCGLTDPTRGITV